MRVIGGEFRSRKLKTPLGDSIRPTPDRLREALFNILAPRIEGLVFLDAYAGSGSVGIEALSRGARRVIFIEKSRAALRALQDNITTLGIRERCDLHPDSAATSSSSGFHRARSPRNTGSDDAAIAGFPSAEISCARA